MSDEERHSTGVMRHLARVCQGCSAEAGEMVLIYPGQRYHSVVTTGKMMGYDRAVSYHAKCCPEHS